MGFCSSISSMTCSNIFVNEKSVIGYVACKLLKSDLVSIITTDCAPSKKRLVKSITTVNLEMTIKGIWLYPSHK